MLIGHIMEKTPETVALDNLANHLADQVRNLWLTHCARGTSPWEENLSEDVNNIPFLRAEGFPGLQGLDYIFKWWGGTDADSLAGELEVLWKICSEAEGGVRMYKTWIRFADRDFILGTSKTETQKREASRAEFRKAFALWKDLYREVVEAG